jgi:hypothetical protein
MSQPELESFAHGLAEVIARLRAHMTIIPGYPGREGEAGS